MLFYIIPLLVLIVVLILRHVSKRNLAKRELKSTDYRDARNNADNAKKPLQLAAEAGDADSQFKLGFALHVGSLGKIDIPKSNYWLKQASDQGHTNAMFFLGMSYWEGDLGEGDKSEAIRLWRMSAEMGDTDSQTQIGSLYWVGDGVKEDHEEAYYWYFLAKISGCKEANQGCDTLCDGLEKEQITRIQERAWETHDKIRDNKHGGFHKAVNAVLSNPGQETDDDIIALLQRGDECFYGKGMKRDLTEAVNYYLKAANLHSAQAQLNLAMCYLNGWGVPKDEAIASKWASQAFENGQGQMLAKLRLD